MQPDPNDLQRQIDALQHQINEVKSVADADRRAQEAERQMLKSDLKESLARSEASTKESLARSEASNKEGLADNKAAIERLRTDMAQQSKDTERQIKNMIIVTIGAIGVGVAIISAVVTINANSTLAPTPTPIIIHTSPVE